MRTAQHPDFIVIQNEAVVKGVKGVVANAHESKQNEKQGRQKWGMFETHYQREKHITLEESLSEM